MLFGAKLFKLRNPFKTLYIERNLLGWYKYLSQYKNGDRVALNGLKQGF